MDSKVGYFKKKNLLINIETTSRETCVTKCKKASKQMLQGFQSYHIY